MIIYLERSGGFAAIELRSVIDSAQLAEEERETVAEEMEYGLVCVAVPILGANGEPVASISVSGPVMRMSEEKKSSIARLLLDHAAAISRQLF